MKYLKKAPTAALIIAALLAAPSCNAQAKAQESGKTSTVTDAKATNTDTYIALLRRDVRQEKSEMMGAMMKRRNINLREVQLKALDQFSELPLLCSR